MLNRRAAASLFVAASGLLAAATATAWIRSERYDDQYFSYGPAGGRLVFVAGGVGVYVPQCQRL